LLSTQAHSDWINDLLLINYNRTVISASSDGTVKAFTPCFYSPELLGTEPSVIGLHSDYVRALAKSPNQPWLASGSFDRTIKLWDPAISQGTSLSGANNKSTSVLPKPLLSLSPSTAVNDPKTSIYALAVSDAWGSMLVSGGPERIVRLWDPRIGSGASSASGSIGKGIGTLVGHTDVVRSLVAGWGGDYVSCFFIVLI
jgi:WD repeat-containing protein 48